MRFCTFPLPFMGGMMKSKNGLFERSNERGESQQCMCQRQGEALGWLIEQLGRRGTGGIPPALVGKTGTWGNVLFLVTMWRAGRSSEKSNSLVYLTGSRSFCQVFFTSSLLEKAGSHSAFPFCSPADGKVL